MKYELTFLLNEEPELINLKKLIESLSGHILKEETWGKKTLSYPIKKARSAVYYFWEFEVENKKIEELRKKLNFNEKLLRYLLIVKE